jgi:hypothetical protein
MSEDHQEFPKWVAPHESWISRQGDHLSVLGKFESHVDRDRNVTVLCHDADDEHLATSPREEPKAEDPSDPSAEG